MVHGGDTVYVFVAMIVLSDQDGNLRMHSAALASRIGKNFESVQQAITNLEMPDPVSSTPDHNGRRIIPLSELTDGAENRGWLIVNKSKYRDMSSREDRREYMREYMRDKRKHEVNNSKRAVSTVEESKPAVSNVSLYTDTDTDTDVSNKRVTRKRPTPITEEFSITEDLRNWAMAKGLSSATIQTETEKFSDWHRSNGSVKADWNATWRTWIRKHLEWKKAETSPTDGAI